MDEKQAKKAFLEAARRAVRKVGWDPRVDLDVLESKPSGSTGSPSYGYRAGRVRLSYSPDLLPRLERIKTDPLHDGPSDAGARLEDVVASRVYMSAGGYRTCPYSAYDYAGILEAAADGLRAAGSTEAEVAEFAQLGASFFIASVVAGVTAIAEGDRERFCRGWPLDLIVSLPEDAAFPSYSALYANVQLRLWSGNPAMSRLLRSRFPRPFDALEFETDRGVAILLDTFQFSGEGDDGLAWKSKDLRELIIDQLKYSWRLWPIKAFQFAELFAPYVVGRDKDQPNPPRPEPSQGGDQTLPSAAAQERRVEVRGRGVPSAEALQEMDVRPERALPGAPTDPFAERFRRDAWFRREVLGSGVGTGIDPLSYHMGFDSLDAIYRQRATKIDFRSETVHRAGMALDVSHMTREKLSDGLPSLNAIDWGATRFGPHGELELYRKSLPITDHKPALSELRGFPDLLFVVDSSGSMAWNPKQGLGSYDSLLRSVYSVLSFLETNNKAQHMKFAAVNFSGQTLSTPWKSYAELTLIKKLLFRHQGGGTVLNRAPLEEVARSASDRFLCLMVTDGQIKNAAEVVQIVGEMLSKGHRFVLIQIGSETPLVHSLRSIGVPAHVMADHKGLEGLCLEYTRRVWGPGGAS